MVAPTTFTTPSLGNLVTLGELYDANSAKFLGVQLYTPESIKKSLIETKRDPPTTKLDVSYSTTFQEKSSVIDVDASLSLDILGGLVSVSGSASYLKDVKSNTSQDCFAMTLSMRGREERIEVGNTNLVALNDNLKGSYLAATHFVSAIQYGGNCVISMVEIVEKLDDDEKISGNMKVKLSEIAGKISLDGSVDVEAKKKALKLDNKFDIQMYGDFTIADVPINTKDTLKVLPEVYASIKSAGVPIKLTLQPIPTTLRSTVTQVHKLSESAVTDLLNAYSRVEDLHNRFVVLENSVMRYKDIVPHLTTAIVDAFTTFREKQVDLLEELRAFLLDSSDTKDDATVLKGATDLYAAHKHKHSDDKIKPPDYPKSLSGLEKAFGKFAGLNLTLKNSGVSFSSYDTLSLYLPRTKQAMLFLTWSVSATAKAKFSSLITDGYVKDYKNDFLCYFVYSEKVSEINDTSLPKGTQITTSDTSGRALFRYTVKDASPKWDKVAYDDMSTDSVKHGTKKQDSSKIYTLPLENKGYMSAYDITTKDGYSSAYWDVDSYYSLAEDKSFTVMIAAKATSLTNGNMLFFIGDKFDDNPQFYCAIKSDKTIDLKVYDTTKSAFYSFTSSSISVDAYSKFVLAFVQDKDNSKWLLYVNGEEKATCSFHSGYKFRQSTNFKLYRFVASRAISDSSYDHWNGVVYKFEGHEGVMKKDNVKNHYYKCI